MLFAIISLGGLGFVLGAGLSIASKKFAVELDPREEAILKALPGANCGACGFPRLRRICSSSCQGRCPCDWLYSRWCEHSKGLGRNHGSPG